MNNTPSPKRFRLSRTQLLRLLTPIAAFIPLAPAADVFKANNPDALNLTTSWTSAALPTAADVAVFDNTLTIDPSLPPGTGTGITWAADPGVTDGWGYMSFPAAASWKGIRVATAAGVNLVMDSYLLGVPALSVGSSGIDLSATAAGNTFQMFGQNITLNGMQTWTVADGATLQFAGPGLVTRATGTTLKLNLGATGTGVINPGTMLGAANATLGYATFGGTDFAVINSSQTALVPGATLGTYTPNPYSDATTPGPNLATTTTAIDVVTSGTGFYLGAVNGVPTVLPTGTAFRISANGGFPGVRFNTPHSGGLDWVVDGTGTTRNISMGNAGILVGPGVGAHNVVWDGLSQFRHNGTSELFFHQFNTAGDLIMNAPFSQQGGTPRITKDGPGRLILTNNSNGFSGPTTINEGTIQVGNGGTTGVINAATSLIVNNGILAFNRTNAFTVPNVISGPGAVQMFGTGTLTLSGANTYTGRTDINGAVVFSSAANLGAGTDINMGTSIVSGVLAGTPTLNAANGGLQWATGNTFDISARTVTIGPGGATLNVGTNNVTFANAIGNSGAGGLTKTGTGTLTLAAAAGNSYAGNTTISAGGLVVNNTSGSGTGGNSGTTVTVANTAVLSGTGTIAGNVTVAQGGKITPALGAVGTLTVGGLSLGAGSLMDLEFTSTSAHDKVVVTGFETLTLNGGSLRLNPTGTANSLAAIGDYNIIQYSGTNVNGTGASSLSVLNPQPGFAYTFSSGGGFVTLAVKVNGVLPEWNAGGSGSWGTGSNWTDTTAAGGGGDYTPQFKANLGAPATVTLDGNRTAKGLSFSGTGGYTLAVGTGGSLTIDNGASTAGVVVDGGNHTIDVPLILNSTTGFNVGSALGLVVSGAVSGPGGVNKTGPGTLDLTGNNSFTGAVNLVEGTLGFGTASGLGAGALTINGGTLRYDSGNTADISSKVITFGINGATLNTNGNNVTFANPVGNAGVGTFTKAGTGTLTLAGANSYTGATFITGGGLAISSNANLGAVATGASLSLDAAVLTPTTTFALNNAGANSRAVAIGTNGAEINVGTGITFTISGALSGAGSLLKSGAGDLTLTGSSSGFSGAVTIGAGNVRLGAQSASGQTGLGTGAITFGDGAHLYLNGQGTDNTNYGTLSNAISVPSGVTANIHAPQNALYSGVVSGGGTINLTVDGANFSVSGVWVTGTPATPSFTGILNLSKTPTGAGTETDDYCLNGAHNLSAATVNIAAGVRMRQNFNPPGAGQSTTHSFGELHAAAGSVLAGNTVGDRYNAYTIGALNTNSTIDAQLIGIAGSFGHGYPRIVKVGTGMLTLRSTTNMMATPSAAVVNTLQVDAGTLNVLGSVESFYRLSGADLIFGGGPGGGADDTLTQTLPTTGVLDVDYQVVQPGPNSVGASGTLAGNGRLGGVTTINGTLRPDATGTLGGQLTFTGAATLILASTAVTQFDISGNTFTGIRSENANGISYSGALKINFLNTVYNGPYQLFQQSGTLGGAFNAGVFVSTTTTTDAPLTDTGLGTFTGVVDGATFTFTPATGILEVSGGTVVVLPSVPGGLSATAGNAQVNLSWNAAANTSSYLVKRSTVSTGPYTTLNSTALTSYSDASVTNGTTYYYVVEGQNAVGVSGNSLEVSATPVAQTNTGVQNWRLANFGSIENSGNGADGADPDGDGFVNLLEYASNRNPNVRDTTPLTVIGRTGDGLRLTLTYTSVADANLVYTLQGVNDLAGTPVWADLVTSTGASNVAGSATLTDTQLISASLRRFLRLSVSYTTP